MLAPEEIGRWRRWRQRRFGNWVGFLRSSYGLLPHDFDDDGAAEAIAAKIRRTGCLECYDGDMPAPHSMDSFRSFVRRNHYLDLDPSSEQFRNRHLRAAAAAERRRQLREATAAAQQAKWEEERRQRQLAKEAEAERLWQANEEKRQELARRDQERLERWHAVRAAEVMIVSAEWARLRADFSGAKMIPITCLRRFRIDDGAGHEISFMPGNYMVPEPVAEVFERDGADVVKVLREECNL